MITLSEESIEKFICCDASLKGMVRVEDGRDLQFQLLLGIEEPAIPTCHWASEVRIDLQFHRNEGGMPLSWECGFERQNRQWRMAFDFASQGTVGLVCNGATLETGVIE